MEEELLRKLVFEALRREPNTQILRIIKLAGEIAKEKELFPDPSLYSGRQAEYYKIHSFPPDDELKLSELIWDLLFQGVLTVGKDSPNDQLPFVRVTAYGEKCIQEGAILPHDPDGYLGSLNKKMPGIDPIIMIYIGEALQTFRRGCYLATMLLLGCASEKAFLLLLDAMKEAIKNPESRGRFESRVQGVMISKKMEAFQRRLSSCKGDLPGNIKDGLDVMLDGIFTLIRINRNEIGHPTGRIMERNETFGMLQMFVPYCKRIYDLIGWFSKNKI